MRIVCDMTFFFAAARPGQSCAFRGKSYGTSFAASGGAGNRSVDFDRKFRIYGLESSLISGTHPFITHT